MKLIGRENFKYALEHMNPLLTHNMFIDYDSKCGGERYIVEYTKKILSEDDLKMFINKDESLFFDVDLKLDSLNAMFLNIARSSVYKNQFTGILGLNLNSISFTVTQKDICRFTNYISNYLSKDVMIIYFGDLKNERIKRIYEELSYLDPHLEMVDESRPYSRDDLVEIVKNDLTQCGYSLYPFSRKKEKLLKVIQGVSTLDEVFHYRGLVLAVYGKRLM